MGEASERPSTSRCPQCDAEFNPSASPMGLCPACLLKLGASSPAWTVPPVEDEPGVSAAVVIPPPAASRQVGWRLRKWIVGAAVVAVALASVFLLRLPAVRPAVPLSTVIRFTLPLPDGADSGNGAGFAVSPDGSRIAFAARGQDGQTRLWVRALQSMEWRELSRTEGARLPFWSPDSRHIAFFAEKKLKRVDPSNGLTQTLCEAPFGRGGSWSNDDTIVFAATSAGPISKIPASGGTPERVTTLDTARGERAHLWPRFLPNGRDVLFTVAAVGGDRDGSQAGIDVVSLESGRRKVVVPGARAGVFAQGYLLYARGSDLLAQAFDASRLQLSAGPQPISGADRVAGSPMADAGFSVSDTGVLVHHPGVPSQSRLTWRDRMGQVRVMGEPANYGEFSLSPDGRRIVVTRRDTSDSSSNLWLLGFDRETMTRLTMGPSYDASPVWHPDGARIVFVSRRAGLGDITVTDASGIGKNEILHKSLPVAHLDDVAPDGRLLVYTTDSPETGLDLWLVPLGGEAKPPQPLYQTKFNESDGDLSPDGRWIAYVSDESGRDEVYVRTFPQPDGRWQVSTAGGHRPRWRRDGRELFFVAPNGVLQSVPLQMSSSFQIGMPQSLFRMPDTEDYDVFPDGQGFLTKAHAGGPDREGLQVILNWSAELRR